MQFFFLKLLCLESRIFYLQFQFAQFQGSWKSSYCFIFHVFITYYLLLKETQRRPTVFSSVLIVMWQQGFGFVRCALAARKKAGNFNIVSEKKNNLLANDPAGVKVCMNLEV